MVQVKGALVLGTLIGAGIGLLMAPEKGSDTRQNLKNRSKEVKDKLANEYEEVTDTLSKAATSGKEKANERFANFKVKASIKTEKAITYIEKKLAVLKEKNKTFQQTS